MAANFQDCGHCSAEILPFEINAPLGLDQERRFVADCLRVSADYKELPAANQAWVQLGMLWSMQMLRLVWPTWYCTVADARFKDIIATTNMQKMGLIKCNCSPELSVIIFRSSQEVRKIFL